MPLQLRRGNAADLAAITPAEGELVYVRPTVSGELPKLYVGDGATSGGILVAGYDDLDAKDAFAASIAAGTQTGITFNYNPTTRAMNATVDLSDYDGILTASAFSGSIVSDTSSVLIDAVDSIIFADYVKGPLTDVTLKGIVYANDDSVIVDPVAKTVSADLVGDVFTSNINSTDSSTVNINTSLSVKSFLTVDDYLRVDGGGRFVSTDSGERIITVESYANSDQVGGLFLRKARGSESSPTAVQGGDRIGQITFQGYDGSSYNDMAVIQTQVDPSIAVGPGQVAPALRFLVRAGGTVLRETATLAQNGSLYLYGITSAAGPLNVYTFHNDGTNASNILWLRARGTNLAPTAVQNGDPIMDLAWNGFDGTNYRNAGQIRVTVDGPVASNQIPGRFEFSTTNTSGVSSVKMKLLNDGKLEIDEIQGNNAGYITLNDMPVLPTYANEATATAAAGGTPINGMMFYDTLTSKIKAYAGGAWVALH